MSDENEEVTRILDELLRVKDEDGNVMLQVALLAAVYFEDAHKREVREAIVACCEDYIRRCGPHLRWALNPKTELMQRFSAGKGSNPRVWLPALREDKSFSIICHGADYERGASSFLVGAMGRERRPFVKLGFFEVAFPLLWFADKPEKFPDVLLEICQKLKPVSGYGGIGVVESPDYGISGRYEPIVYQWAQIFPGLEANYPTSHSIWLEHGIKGVNWLTVVGDKWLAKMGGADAFSQELAELDGRFVVHRFGGGVMIQAGPRPQLGNAPRDRWPELYVKLSKKLRPIRITKHRPFQLAKDPGVEYFDLERSEAWLRRFDDR